MRWFCRLSYVRTKQLFDLLGIRCPSKSALQYTSAKLDTSFWRRVLKATCGSAYLVALDSTGLSRTFPSYHYLRRIDGGIPKIPIKLSAAFDTRKKRFSAANVRVLPAHDIRDAKKLIEDSSPEVIVADKAYDANWLHKFCKDQGVTAHIPIRAWSKPRHGCMSPRLLASKIFRKRTYHRRELIEAGFSSLKRRFGSSVSSRKARTIRTEVYGRLACHNLFGWLFGLLG